MSQETFDLLEYVFQSYHAALQVVLFLVLWNVFFRQKWGKGDVIFAGILGASNLILKLGFDTPTLGRYFLSAVIVLGYCGLKYKKYLEKAVFVLLLFYNFHALCYLLANSIYMYVVDIMLDDLDVLSEKYLDQMYQIMTICQGLLLLAYTLFFVLMIWSVRKVVKKPFPMKWHDTVFLSALNLVGGMVAGMVMELSVVQIDKEAFVLFDEKEEMIWKVPVMAFFIFIGEVFAIYIFQKNMGLLEERQKHFVEEQQVKTMKQRLLEAEKFYGSIRTVRHQMKSHMTNIKGLVAGEKYGEVESYIEKLDESIQELDYKFNTGNAVTDVIINDKYRRANKSGISFLVQFFYGEGDTIPAFDIGIILNNLLDNAIEACEKMEEGERFISLMLKRKNHFLLLEVENSFDGMLKWEDGERIPVTSKHSELPDVLMEHGIGLKNVKDVAERYLGYMDIKAEGNVFKVTVMLQQVLTNTSI